MSVEIVRYLAGAEHSAVIAATTSAGLKRQIRAAQNAGFRVRFRGTRDALRTAGALSNVDGVLCLHVGAFDYRCLVTDAEVKPDPTPHADGPTDNRTGDAQPAASIVWAGPYRDKRAVLPDGRILRVWFANHEWKCSIGEKKAAPRGVSYAFSWEAQAAVLKEAGVTA